MESIRVIKAGFQSTIQDLGRCGFRKFGVPVCGAMDSKSMRDANKIVGNPESNPVIEQTFYGGIYKFNEPAIISITGSNSGPTLNDRQIPQYEAIRVESGDKLEIHHPSRGCRSYLAIQGHIDVPKVLDSYSTYLLGSFGGYEGRTLRVDDEIRWMFSLDESLIMEFPKKDIPYFSSKIVVDIEKGLEFEIFDEPTLDLFRSTSFAVSSQSNRMGIRLSGEKIGFNRLEMVSSPVVPGIIQLPPSGNPIILMNDSQTIGGYPRIGVVKESELWRLGQVKSGDQIRFNIIE